MLNSQALLLTGSDTGNTGCSSLEGDYVKFIPKNNGNIYNNGGVKTSIPRVQGTEYTISFEILTPNMIGFYWYPSEKYTMTNYIKSSDKWQKISFTYTQTGEDKSTGTLFGFNGLTKGVEYRYRNLQLEIGNKATSWRPAPEDTVSAIDSAKAEAISTASTDATNKANNAKNEAITSANNTLTTTIKNYYTKAQTDSQINVAKNAITSSVSSAYATKTDVTSSINGVNSSISNLQNRMNSAEQKITDSAIVSTVTNSSSSYATKTDVTSSINGVNSSISNLQNRMNSAEQKITDSAIVSTVTNSSSWQTQTSNLNSALNKLSINEQTKMNGLELLPQGYLTNDSKGYKVDYNVTKWQNNRIEVTGREWIRTDFIKFDRSKPLYWHINASCSSNNLFYFGIERFDKNKLTINGEGNNATYYLVSGTNFNGEREGYWQETDTSTAYIRLRILCDWNNTGTATTTIKSIKWKQLGASITDDLATRMSTAESKITDTAITNVVKQNFYTKTETENAITSKGLGASITDDLATRMSTAESKITDTAITNVVKQNFYTKTETENAITSKGYATQSQVQQTANDITFKFSQSGGYNLIRNGGFEKGIAHWSKNNNPSITENQVWQNYHGKSIFISGTAQGSGIYQFFPTVPGKIYSYSFYAQAEHGIWFAGVENRHTQNIEVSPNNWRRYTGTFTATNNSHAFICYAHGSGRNVFLDNVIVCEGALPSEYTPHPSEIYDGITTIDKSGVKVSASDMNGYTHMTEYGLYVNKGGKDLVSVDRYGLRLFDAKIQLTHANGNKYFLLDENGIVMYNPANGTHQWGKVSAINNKFTVASNGNSNGLSLGHHVNENYVENYVEDILCDSNGVVTVQRQMNHAGIYNNTYGQMFVGQFGQGGWEITGRSDSQSIKPGGANQGAIGSNTQYINQSWIANRYNPSSLEFKHLSHYVDDLECLKLVSEVQPARYFYKEYDEEGNDITTFTTRTSQLGLIYEDVRECTGRDLITNEEEDKAINLYNMVSTLWGAVRNLNQRLNELEIENLKLNNELEQIKATQKEVI